VSWALRRRGEGPSLGRRSWRHLGVGPELELPEGHSLLVVGPTQVGKTSSLVVPAILRWPGPVVVTSVKADVVGLTRPWRAALGHVDELRPGQDDGATWDPLESVATWRDALGVARDLVVEGRGRTSSESEFWNALAVKLLGALIVAVREEGGSVYDLVAEVEDRRFLEVPRAVRDPAVDRVLRAFTAHEPRTADAVATTVEAMLVPWQVRQPLARVAGVVDGANTLYLVAPRQDQRRYEGLLRGALRAVLVAQQHRVDEGRAGRLLLVLDEAAAVAPLEDLDQLAATGSGLGVTLLSVFQDFAQMEARWGERAATIVNNHATRLVLGGLVDPRATTYLPELRGSEERPTTLRHWPRGAAALVSGRRPVMTTRLVPWWRQRRLRRRVGPAGPPGALGTMPR
jgi:type IV secretory pathway TraG/TraD family ATPase VirD4